MSAKKATARTKPRPIEPTAGKVVAARRERVSKSIDKVLTKHAGTMAKLAR